MEGRRSAQIAIILIATVHLATLAGQRAAVESTGPAVPLCPGLTIVTAVNQTSGDYESIKTIESVGPQEVRLKYSSERPDADIFAIGPVGLKQVVMHRTVLAQDLLSATSYQQVFLEDSEETIPGTTSIGTSAAVLDALRTKGEIELRISNAYSGLQLTADRNTRPNYYDYMTAGQLKRVGTGPVRIPVLVNDRPVELPAIQAQGDFVGDRAEFFFLDDDRNPLVLAFRLGIGVIKPLDPVSKELCEAGLKSAGPFFQLPGGGRCDRPAGGDRDTLRVVKIAYRCSEAPQPIAGGTGGGAGPGGGWLPGGAESGGATALEQALAESGSVDVYSIYFSFNSDAIREESEPTLHEIAEVLRRRPDWTLRVNGHTDGIGGDEYNLDLSKRRAAAVKEALVTRHGIAAGRLTTAGFGKSQPKDTNDTLEGRARNRRVELVRL
jgi:outer membrane protein OmpA-like peptidoglycan-associated protein